MRVVLDTNILVSALAIPSSVPGRIVQAAINGQIEICITDHLWAELLRALTYPKVRKLLASRGVKLRRGVLERLRSVFISIDDVEPGKNWVALDPDDNWVIQCALSAKANRIVSGDKHLRALGKVEEIPIVAASDFVQVIETDEESS